MLPRSSRRAAHGAHGVVHVVGGLRSLSGPYAFDPEEGRCLADPPTKAISSIVVFAPIDGRPCPPLGVVTRLVEVWFTHDRVRRQHAWAHAVRDDLGGVALLPRFGASDCGCEAHLYRFRNRPSGEAFARSVRARRT